MTVKGQGQSRSDEWIRQATANGFGYEVLLEV